MDFDIALFIGRFHPLLVHLPIGFILIALIMELFPEKATRGKKIIWFLCFLASLLSIISGFQLSSGSSYPIDTLARHKWLGIAICSISFVLWAFGENLFLLRNKIIRALKGILFLILMIGGHFGGQLTHGNEYLLEAAPKSIKKLFGIKEAEAIDLSELHTDSIFTYEHLIQPFIKNKCGKCHNDKNANGGLNLSHLDSINLGSTNGPVLVPHNAEESEMFVRVTLDQNNKKFMPTKGTPLRYDEMELLKWWISNGSNKKERTGNIDLSPEMIMRIQKMYNVDLSSRPWYEKEKGPQIDSSMIKSVISLNFSAERMSMNDNFLQLIFIGEEINNVLPFEEDRNVIIFDAKGKKISDIFYPEISKFKNLIRLQLNGTPTNSEQILRIQPLERLESINLYNTRIDDNALIHLAKFPALRRIYTWQTQVSEDGIKALKEIRPDIKVNNGI